MKINPSARLNPLRHLLLLFLLAFGLPATLGHAGTYNPPQLMSYQGYVTDANGNPLGSTNTGPKNYNMVFRIWDIQTGGTTNGADNLYAEQQTVTVNNGYFSVLLGQGSQYANEPHTNQLSGLFTGATGTSRFVEITVLGIGAGGGNITIAPRLQLLTSPYAFLSANAVNSLNANSAASLVNANNTKEVTVAPNGNIGIGTSNPAYPLDVAGIGQFSPGLQIGQGIATGLYGDGGNIALRTYNNGAIYFQDANGNSTDMYIGNNGNVGIGTTSPGAQLQIGSGSVGNEAFRLSGADFSGHNNNPVPDGVSLLLGVNLNGNRQLWIGESDQLAANSVNGVVRIIPETSGGYIDSVGTDGTTQKPLRLGTKGSLTINTDGSANIAGGLALSGGISSPKWNVTRVINAVGPLPVSGTFNSSGGTLVITAFSGGRGSSTGSISIGVTVDGVSLGSMFLFINQAAVHLALVPKTFIIPSASTFSGTHTLTLTSTSANLITDFNDGFNVTVEELPF